ncbi:hypothetical protein [Paenibacillus sp. DMB20]|uniref:hypothetical protein n=1 Tax=Paenibacillus sp. DMB20 TaxID=1642570 RepID=UPI001F3BB60C|nr:hypothetical protein [Paenibacillus sp. DMB20]
MFDDVLTRDNEIAHVTSSAFVVNKNRNKALMVHHNIFNSWSWAGGHADGDLHLSVAYLLEGDENETLVVKPDENSSVQWIPFREINMYSNESHMKVIYNKIISKIENLSI